MTFPVYFYIGYWRIHPQFVFEVLAYAIAFRLLLGRNIIKQDTITPSQRSSVIVGGMVGALLGAKFLVGLQHIYLLWQNWQLWLLLLLQGKTIVGALLGALIGVEVTKKMIGLRRSTEDVFVYPLIVATAIGRIGCFLTGLSDLTYGVATILSWGVDFGDGIYRHPAQIYEIIFLLALAILIQIRSRYQRQEGDLFKFYIIAYLVFRFLIDLLKPDFHVILGLSAIQIAWALGLGYYWAIRAYYHDRVASAHIASHRQPVVVELGAGMFTRFHRIGSKVYRWFDLDLPVVTDLRRQLDTQTEQHQLISSSVLDFSWMDAMPEVPPENFLFIAEGWLMYLPTSDVQRLICQMRSRFSGATLLMDVLGNIGQLGLGKTQFDRLGAPFKWYVEDEGEVAAMGLSPVKVASLPQLCPERWPFLITWRPPLRNSYLIVEAKIEPS